jgi:hypothetical protein
MRARRSNSSSKTSSDHVHISQPAEVAEVIGWLCSAAARLVTGNIIRLR